ncbi:MAG: aminoacyl-tRNA hydrolase [Coriobacteriia bacterium]|nr:aminoacyl-tRNA hydrolase [Coriobacteriia bacterium]
MNVINQIRKAAAGVRALANQDDPKQNGQQNSNTKKSDRFLIVGLGNPGIEYQKTRHNAGFMAIDALAADLGANYWKAMNGALVAECDYHDKLLILAKPQSFMNSSGIPVKSLLKHFALSQEAGTALLVVHDELDLPSGVLRLKFDGGHGGHRGVLSIIDNVGSGFCRLRLGIGRPPGRMPAEKFVLQELKNEALQEMEEMASQAITISKAVIDDGLAMAMNRFNI